MKYDRLFYAMVLVSAPVVAHGADEMPAADFLEFLGEWELPDGDWVSPEEILRLPIPDVPEEKPDVRAELKGVQQGEQEVTDERE